MQNINVNGEEIPETWYNFMRANLGNFDFNHWRRKYLPETSIQQQYLETQIGKFNKDNVHEGTYLKLQK